MAAQRAHHDGQPWRLRDAARRYLSVLALSIAIAVAAMDAHAPAHARTRAELIAHFEAAAQVFFHPRCVNCHAAGDAPLQTDASVVHAMQVKRGAGGVGTPAMPCVACHAQSPVEIGSGLPPAAAGWRMPPADRTMTFVGLDAAELCRRLKDPEVTGRASLRESLQHVLHDDLVSWAFEPGPGRSKPPLGKAEFFKRLGWWVRDGAPCPDAD